MNDIIVVMKWPLLACLLLPGLLVYLGLHIVRREVIFVDLALAQMASLGACIGLLSGHDALSGATYLWSFGFTLVGAAIFALTRRSHRRGVPQEALIGIVYVMSAAAGILLLSRMAEGNEELRRILIGDVLLVTPAEVSKTFALYLGIAAVHFLFRRQFLMISFEPERAVSEKLPVGRWDFLFYALFGLVVTSFVQIGGVLLVFSYLIIPAVCANLLAKRLGMLLVIGWTVATIGSMAGLATAYRMDLPTGAAIVCALGATMLVCGVLAVRRRPDA